MFVTENCTEFGMEFGVTTSCMQAKVLNVIIQFVSIGVVDDFSIEECST